MDDVQAFIQQQRTAGKSDQDIAVELLYAGWTEEQARAALQNEPIPAQKPLPQTPKKQASPSAVAMTNQVQQTLPKILLVIPALLVITGILIGISAF